MTRDEHLQWAKDRALEYVDHGDITNAIASMISDLGKHDDLRAVQSFAAITGILQVNGNDARRWIEGFN